MQNQLSNYDGWLLETHLCAPAIATYCNLNSDKNTWLISHVWANMYYVHLQFPPLWKAFCSNMRHGGSITQHWGYQDCSAKRCPHLYVSRWKWRTSYEVDLSLIGAVLVFLSRGCWQCHGRWLVCVWWLGLGAWCSTPMQMASQMVDIYTTRLWKVTSVETALSLNTPSLHYVQNSWPVVKDIEKGGNGDGRNVWHAFQISLVAWVGLPVVYAIMMMMMVTCRDCSFLKAWKCNLPKCKVHDFLKIFQIQHGFHFSWEHSYVPLVDLQFKLMQLGPPGRDAGAQWDCSHLAEQL